LPLPRRPSPALLIACSALLAALAGTGVAAVTALPEGSVGTVQLADDAVISPKIPNGGVTSLDVANSTITGADVRDRSLTKADFKPGSLPPGPRGATGAQGPQGPKGSPGTSARQVVKVESALSSTSSKSATAACPAGKKALGGGVEVSGDGRDRVSVTGSVPAGDAGWQARAVELLSTSAPWQLHVYAVCAFVAS